MAITEDFYKNEYVKRAYESVLVLSLMRQTGDLYNKFKSEVKVRALADYGYTLEESETVRRFLSSLETCIVYNSYDLRFRELFIYCICVCVCKKEIKRKRIILVSDII